MVVLHALAMGLRGARAAWRHLALLVFVALVVWIGLPFQAQQVQVLASMRTAAAQAANLAAVVSALQDRYYQCTYGLRILRNRLVGFVYGTIQLVAEDLGFIAFVRDAARDERIAALPPTERALRNMRLATPAPPDPATYCKFVNDVTSFFTDFVDIITVPFFALLGIVTRGPVGLLTLLEAIHALIRDIFYDAIDFGGCGHDLPWSYFACFCHRWHSADEVPRALEKAALACVLHSYNPDTDDYLTAIVDAVGLGQAIHLLNVVLAQVSSLYAQGTTIMLVAVNQLGQIANLTALFADLSSRVAGLASDAADFFKKLFDDIKHLFTRDSPEYAEWQALLARLDDPGIDEAARQADYVVREAELRAGQANATDSLEIALASPPPPGARGPLRVPPRAVTPPPVRPTPLFGRRGEVRNASAAVARARTLRGVAHSMPAERRASWEAVVSNFYAALTSEVPLSAAEVLSAHRAAGVRGADLARSDPALARECAARAVQDMANGMLRGAPPADAPPNVSFSGTIIATFCGAIILFMATCFCGVLFPPTFVAVVFAAWTSLIVTIMFAASTQAAGLINAASNGNVNGVAYIQTLVAAAQYVGAGYLTNGAELIDPVELFKILQPYLAADLWFSFTTPPMALLCALPLDLCPPPLLRGATIAEHVIGIISCQQNATCSVVEDCPGRASSCLNGGCMCWGYVQEWKVAVRVSVDEADNTTCEAYGYRFSDILPRQTGGFGWTNVEATFQSFAAGLRDIAQFALDRNAVTTHSLVVYIGIFVPFLATVAWVLGPVAFAALIVQEALLWVLHALRWAHLSGLSWLAPAYQTPDHGLTCAFLNSPSIVLWLAILAAAWIVAIMLMALIAFVWTILCGIWRRFVAFGHWAFRKRARWPWAILSKRANAHRLI
jgi:hypothetical protein